MTAQCASCGQLREGCLHTAQGWICNPCEKSASTIVQVYVINGRRFHKLLKGIEVKTETPSAVTEGASRKESATR